MPSNRKTNLTAVAAAAMAVALAATGCGGDDNNDQASDKADPAKSATSGKATAALTTVEKPDKVRELVGAIKGTDIYVAVTLSEKGGKTTGTAYFCDGKNISQWLNVTSLKNGKITFASKTGASFEGTITDKSITGTAKLAASGDTHQIAVDDVPVDGQAGLYFADHVFESDLGDDERAGWIVLPDGSQRGAIRGTSTILPGSVLNTTNLSVTAAGRNLTLGPINQIIGLDMSS